MESAQLSQHAAQLQQAGQLHEAEAAYRRAIKLAPNDPATHYNLGNVCLELERPADAIVCYLAALRLASDHPQILLQLGNAYSAMGRFNEAVAHFQKSTSADRANSAAYFNLGNALRELARPTEAAAAYQAALKLNPNDADTHNNLGNVLRELGRLDEAIACYREALRLNPRLHHAKVHLLHQCQHICDWRDFDTYVAEVRELVMHEPKAQVSPFAFLALPGTTAAEQRQCASQWVANRYAGLMRQASKLAFSHSRQLKPKLRIGYLSGDFRLHPLAFLISELIELHDRSHFEVFSYSYAKDDNTAERKRLEQAFDRFVDIRSISQQDAAKRIHADAIDILVDLTGFTQGSRSGIVALRPAPIQVSWLGFPGTMGGFEGAPFFDYLISDAFITPPEQADCYAEQLVLMPDCYQPNDRKRPIAAFPTRAASGLPEQGFVFCCFNQTFKITPQVYDIWMNILNSVSGSVLWLLDCNRWAKENLRCEARLRGVDPDRLIFAPRVPVDQHLARHTLAGLFLDTLPYNAHTTTSDALWMGLPVLTCAGETFASRVAASLLLAANLPQLITYTLQDYEARALALANNPAELAAINQKLTSDKQHLPLFDTQRFARHLELAYQTMWQNLTRHSPQAIKLMIK